MNELRYKTKEDLLTKKQVLEKLKRMADKIGTWHFSDHRWQLQAEEAKLLLDLIHRLEVDYETAILLL